MQFAKSLLKGKLIKRYKRFLADVEFENGEVVTVHCANSGGLYGVTTPGLTVWLSESDNPTRKLKYTWEMAEVDGTIVGVNTSWPNALVEEAIHQQVIKELSNYATLKREVKYGANSRLDILLQDPIKGDCFVEVKNVHMCREPSLAEFPDGVTTRGTKHLTEMMSVVQEGKRAVMLYIIQRQDCQKLKFAADIDPVYAQTALKAKEQGVEFHAYCCDVNPTGIRIKSALPILL